ncbi:MAG: hypothetical protein JST33_13380 [Actinobacteria bacterium]|nr:hypothetical protein [Actinomycetota bacterium]
MGMFTQKPEEKGEWAALPAEPFERDGIELLPDPPVADPLGRGVGTPIGPSITISLTGASESVGSVSIPLPGEDAAAAAADDDDGSASSGSRS